MDDGLIQEKHENFLKEKSEHIGEEVADCFIYTVRLSDLCKINLSKATQGLFEKDNKIYNFQDCEWNHLNLKDVIDIIDSYNTDMHDLNDKKEMDMSSSIPLQSMISKSPRSCILELNKYLGKASSSFLAKSEIDSGYGLPSWSSQEIENLATSFASIIVCLICIAKLCNISIERCLYDKMNKNIKKYPVDKCKGKSSKYTAYMKKTVPVSNAIVVGAVVAATFFMIGRSIRHNK